MPFFLSKTPSSRFYFLGRRKCLQAPVISASDLVISQGNVPKMAVVDDVKAAAVVAEMVAAVDAVVTTDVTVRSVTNVTKSAISLANARKTLIAAIVATVSVAGDIFERIFFKFFVIPLSHCVLILWNFVLLCRYWSYCS